MEKIKNRGWSVAMGGLGINLALGILYTWSIFKLAIKDSIVAGDGRFNWDLAYLNDPYAVCCLVFAFTMIVAGRVQDKLSPRLTAMIGGVLTGLGLMVISQSYSLAAWVLGFGVLTGAGIGFGYASATPPAIKWFPSAKTGLVAGVVVAGFGLASVYIAPLANHLIGQFGLSSAMMIFGAAFLVVVCLLSLLLVNPPAGYVHPDQARAAASGPSRPASNEFTPAEMLKNRNFYLLWAIYAVGAGAGLMIIGNVAGMAKETMGELAWVVVALMAVGNAGGRIAAGVLSDKIGRTQTMAIMFTFQALVMFSLILIGEASAFIVTMCAALIGFNYGTNLSLFPSAAKDYFGLKNFGVNYGLLFTAWGVGGFVLPRVSQMIVAATGTFDAAYVAAGALLILSAGLTVVVERPERVAVRETSPGRARLAEARQRSLAGRVGVDAGLGTSFRRSSLAPGRSGLRGLMK
jgi:nitrate/nitrite transporter NarK